MRAVQWLLAFTPALVTAITVYRYGVNVVRMDELDIMVKVFAAHHDGKLTLDSLLAQANESRPMFPRLIILGLGLIDGWNTRIEMFVMLGLVLTNLLLMLRIGRAVAGSARSLINPFVAFLMALALFSLWQLDFLWGFQMLVHIPMTCILVAMALVHSRLHMIAVVAAGSILCFVSTYSYANGLLAWPLVGTYIGYVRFREFRRRWWLWPIFLAAFAGTAWLYFADYLKPPHHPPFTVVHRDFLPVLLAFFGAPLGSIRTDPIGFAISAIWGGFLLSTLLGICLWTVHRRTLHTVLLLYMPIVIIAAYVGVSAVVTTAGRLGFGRDYTWLQTRYAGFSTYLIATVILAVALLRHPAVAARLHTPALRGFSYVFAAACGSYLVSQLWVNLVAYQAYPAMHRGESQLRAGLAVVEQVDVPELKEAVFPSLQALRMYVVEGRRVGVLPKGLAPADFANPALPARPAGHIDAFLFDGRVVQAEGWAYLPTGRPADGVVVTTRARGEDPKIVGVAFPTVARPDLKAALGAQDFHAGWRYRVELAGQPGGIETGTTADAPVEVHFWAVDGNTRQVYWIGGR